MPKERAIYLYGVLYCHANRAPSAARGTRAYAGWLLGHSLVQTTMICTHVLNKGPMGVVSPVDLL